MVHLPADGSLSPSVFTTEESTIIQCALGLIEEKRLLNRQPLRHRDELDRYLRLRFAGLTNEQGHALYLDPQLRLIAAETEAHGNQSSCAFDMRRIALRAITLGAEHVVFAHNHPSGNATPSVADVRHLLASADALRPLGIAVLDSFVVTATQVVSIRDHWHAQQAAMAAQQQREREQRRTQRRAKAAARMPLAALQHQGAAA